MKVTRRITAEIPLENGALRLASESINGETHIALEVLTTGAPGHVVALTPEACAELIEALREYAPEEPE